MESINNKRMEKATIVRGISSVRKSVKYGLIAVIVIIIIGTGAFYLASPLFISTQVNEPLPTNAVESEVYQKFISINEEERMQAAKQMSTQERDEIMSSAARVNNSINEPMNQTQAQEEQERTLNTTTQNVLRAGSFIGIGDGIHNAEGIAKIIPLEDGTYILRLENLRVTNGPDLYVYLSPDKSASDFVNVGKLKANNGNQNYDIPAGINLSKYDTVLVWCRPFSVLFGSAELTST
jgi:electron transfer DM13